jgi:hypothetical protein
MRAFGSRHRHRRTIRTIAGDAQLLFYGHAPGAACLSQPGRR